MPLSSGILHFSAFLVRFYKGDGLFLLIIPDFNVINTCRKSRSVYLKSVASCNTAINSFSRCIKKFEVGDVNNFPAPLTNTGISIAVTMTLPLFVFLFG
jgi:hypothetical protein